MARDESERWEIIRCSLIDLDIHKQFLKNPTASSCARSMYEVASKASSSPYTNSKDTITESKVSSGIILLCINSDKSFSSRNKTSIYALILLQVATLKN